MLAVGLAPPLLITANGQSRDPQASFKPLPSEHSPTETSAQRWRSGIYVFEHAGFRRTFRLHVPSGSNPTIPGPLILMFHGWGGDENEFLGVHDVVAAANARGYTLLAPVGLGPEEPGNSRASWAFRGSTTGLDGDGINAQVKDDTTLICDPKSTPDYTYPSCQGIAQSTCGWTHCLTDDADFVIALVSAAKVHLPIDPNQIFAVGGSNGGMFVWDLAQNEKTANHFGAFASLIGLPHRGYHQAPSVGSAKPMLLITGGLDTTVPPGNWGDQRFTTTQNGESYFYTSASAIMLSWANALGCDTSVPAQTVAQDHNEIECRTWRRCNRTVDTREILDCRAARMGHEYKLDITWPMVLDFFDQFR